METRATFQSPLTDPALQSDDSADDDCEDKDQDEDEDFEEDEVD